MFIKARPPLKVFENAACIGHEQRFTPSKRCVESGTSVLRFFHSPMGETTGRVCECVAKLWVSEESIVRHSDGQQVFLGKLVGEVLKDAQREAVHDCPKTRIIILRETLTLLCTGDDFVAVCRGMIT